MNKKTPIDIAFLGAGFGIFGFVFALFYNLMLGIVELSISFALLWVALLLLMREK